jgi:kynurenine formamidase
MTNRSLKLTIEGCGEINMYFRICRIDSYRLSIDLQNQSLNHFTMAQLIDLSHPIETGMPVFPGSEGPELNINASLAQDGFNEARISMSTHTGTHIDCGYHILKNGLKILESPLENFFGTAIVVDCTNVQAGNQITCNLLKFYESELTGCAFVLLYTGWSRYWGNPEYFSGYPVLDTQAAEYLTSFSIRGVGTDTISVDPVHLVQLPVHHILLSGGLILIENLTRLEALPESGFSFSCLPLPLATGDGSPVRAVGIVSDRD